VASWQEVYQEVPDAPFGRGKDERALTEAFEQFVGGPERAFRLMRIHGRARGVTSGNRYRLHRKGSTTEKLFVRFARSEGFSEDEVRAYLDVR
jgi:hypothetical protein